MPRVSVRKRLTHKSYWKNKKKSNAESASGDNNIDGDFEEVHEEEEEAEVEEGIFRVEEDYTPFLEHCYGKSSSVSLPIPSTSVECSAGHVGTNHSPVSSPSDSRNSNEIDPVIIETVEAVQSLNLNNVTCIDNNASGDYGVEHFSDEPAAADSPNTFVVNVEDDVQASVVVNSVAFHEDKKVVDAPNTVLSILRPHLPPRWSAALDNNGIRVNLLSPDAAHLPQRSILFSSDGCLKVFAHGHELPSGHPVYNRAPTLQLTAQNVQLYSEEIQKYVAEVRLFEICVAIRHEDFKVWWKNYLDCCFIDKNHFHEDRYSETLRSNQCEYLVVQPKKYCNSCQTVIRRMKKRKKATTASTEIKTPSKFKPSAHLSSAEKKARDKRKSKNIKVLKQKVRRLDQQISSLIETEGVVDDNLDEDLNSILNKGLSDLSDKKSEDPRDKFLAIFLQQQLQSRNAKGNKGIKWHPLMIRFALHLKLSSQSALNAARNFVRLPSDRLLWDYTHMYEVQPGLQYDFINEAAEQVSNMKYKYQQFHVLAFDEMVVAQRLVQRKSTGEVVGYQKLNEVQTEILDVKTKLEAEAQFTKPENPQPQIAKRVLTFMVKGTASGVQTSVASYPLSTLAKEDLHQWVWEVTGALETCGIKVIAFVCDGGAVNRGFFQMLPNMTETSTGLKFDTPNPWEPERPIFLIPDPPHALKTARNCLENSGRKKSRHMWRNGEYITWKPIIRLWKWKSEQTVKKLHKLTAAAVFLNSYSRMSVPLACRVMSNSVGSQIRLLEWPGTKELCVFNKF